MYEWNVQRMQNLWSWLRCLFSPHAPPSLVLYHSGGVNLAFTRWNREREWFRETQPGLHQDNIFGCGDSWGSASARWNTLWGSTAMHLSSFGTLPEANTAAVPWDRAVEREDMCSWQPVAFLHGQNEALQQGSSVPKRYRALCMAVGQFRFHLKSWPWGELRQFPSQISLKLRAQCVVYTWICCMRCFGQGLRTGWRE